jgi:hypothetical protein
MTVFHIQSTNKSTEFFRHAAESPFFPPKIALCFIKLSVLVCKIITFYVKGALTGVQLA